MRKSLLIIILAALIGTSAELSCSRPRSSARDITAFYELGYKNGFINCQQQTRAGLYVWKTDSGYSFNINYAMADSLMRVDSVVFVNKLKAAGY